jgi:stage V sporulation protein D (sporulation-specific penicillin-binding protein)
MPQRTRQNSRGKPGSGQKPNKTILRRTLVLMGVCGIAAFVVLAVKLYQVQILQHDYYEKLAVEQQTRQSVVKAARGTIFDTNGKVLAMSASVETVFISPYEMNLYGEDKNLIADKLSAILGVDKNAILDKMADTRAGIRPSSRKSKRGSQKDPPVYQGKQH